MPHAADGTGVAIGKMAENNELFECRWPAKFNGNVTIGSSSTSKAPNHGIHVHDVRNVDVTPDSFGDNNVNFYFDQVPSMSDRWMGIMHMKGWTGSGYASWELAGNAHNNLNDDTLRYRQGVGETWGDWQTVLTDKNIGNYVSQSGGTSTGMLDANGGITLPGQKFYVSGNYGINCSNSDIVNVNSLYFSDVCDAEGEGIHFGRSNGNWDTLYSVNGVLKFHSNRTTADKQSGHVIYNSSNFRCGSCTLSSSADTTITFTSAFGGTPTVMLTPLTSSSGVIAAKVKSVNASGFTAMIGGSAVESAQFVYFAIL